MQYTASVASIEDILSSLQDIPAKKKDLIEILEMTESYAFSEESKFTLYEPNPISRYVHASTAKCRAMFGGNRSSKTYTMMVDLASQFRGEVPKSLEGVVPNHRLDKTRKIRLCVEDYPNAFIKVIYPYIQKLIPSDKIVDVVKSEGRIRAITNDKGGFIEFMFYESDVEKFQGSSRDVCAYDEEPPEQIRGENLARLVDLDGEEIFALTPLSGSVTFLYKDIFLKAGRTVEMSDGRVRDVSIPTGDSHIHTFFMDIYDNRAITKEAADRILSLFPEEERLVRKSGAFMFRGGLVYPEFSDANLIEPFDDWLSNDWTLYIAIDPHPRTPHAVLFMAVRRDGFMAIVDELFVKCGSASELVTAIQAKCRGKTPNVIIIDPLAFTPNPSDGSCFAYDLAEAGLYPAPISASKDKSRGIILTRSLLAPDKDTGKPSLYVCRNCATFRSEIATYAWDEWSRNVSMRRGEKQKPMDKDDHMMENLYRLVLLRPEYVPELED